MQKDEYIWCHLLNMSNDVIAYRPTVTAAHKVYNHAVQYHKDCGGEALCGMRPEVFDTWGMALESSDDRCEKCVHACDTDSVQIRGVAVSAGEMPEHEKYRELDLRDVPDPDARKPHPPMTHASLDERMSRSYEPRPRPSRFIHDMHTQHTVEEMWLWQLEKSMLQTEELKWYAAYELRVDLSRIDFKACKYLGPAPEGVSRVVSASRRNMDYNPKTRSKFVNFTDLDTLETPEETFLWHYSVRHLCTPALRWRYASDAGVNLMKIDLRLGRYLG